MWMIGRGPGVMGRWRLPVGQQLRVWEEIGSDGYRGIFGGGSGGVRGAV